MQCKIYLLCLILLTIIVQAISLDGFNRKASKKEKDEDDIVDDDPLSALKKFMPADDEPQLISSNRRNRPPSQGPSSSNNYRQRSRWSSPPPLPQPQSLFYDDSSDLSDWLSYGPGPSGIFPGFPGAFPPSVFDTGAYLSNGPTCHSLLDPIYPVFADICGSVPQARYSLPNAFGHTERWQIAQVLSVLLGPATPSAGNPVCSRSLRLLVCPLLFPPCPTRYEAPPVLPCQPFCRIVKSQCASPSLDLLPCDLLPPTSDLCPINPTPYSSLLSSFGAPFPMPGPLPPLGLPQSPLSSLLAQSALAGFSPMDIPPSMFPPFLGQQPTFGGPSPMDIFPQVLSPMFPTSPFPQGMTPPAAPSQGAAPSPSTPGGPTPAVPPTPTPIFTPPTMFTSPPQPGSIPPAFASLFGQSVMPSLHSPMNPFLGDSLSPILVDFPPMQFGQSFANPRFFPRLRSSTEKA